MPEWAPLQGAPGCEAQWKRDGVHQPGESWLTSGWFSPLSLPPSCLLLSAARQATLGGLQDPRCPEDKGSGSAASRLGEAMIARVSPVRGIKLVMCIPEAAGLREGLLMAVEIRPGTYPCCFSPNSKENRDEQRVSRFQIQWVSVLRRIEP